ncbi:MAG: hypothetical protein AB7S26_03925 [Sandaracinaceae bacterium]
MGAEKLSISLDSELAAMVRRAAAEERVSTSEWLARAAEARMRRAHLGAALDAFAEEHGSLSPAQVGELIEQARERSIVTNRVVTNRAVTNSAVTNSAATRRKPAAKRSKK